MVHFLLVADLAVSPFCRYCISLEKKEKIHNGKNEKKLPENNSERRNLTF